MPWVIFASVLLVVAIITLVVVLMRHHSKRKQEWEQISKKMREDALNKAISNGSHRVVDRQATSPTEVHYNNLVPSSHKGAQILSIVVLEESLSKEYLFNWSDHLFLGEEHGKSAIFRQLAGQNVFCEIFNYKNSIYVRQCGNAQGQLIRGKRQTALDSKGIKLCSRNSFT